MRTIKTDDRRRGDAGRRPADGARSAVQGDDREARARSTFEDMVREIQHIIDQMTDDERRQYLSESLFLNFVSYENERLGAYMKKLAEEVAVARPCP